LLSYMLRSRHIPTSASRYGSKTRPEWVRRAAPAIAGGRRAGSVRPACAISATRGCIYSPPSRDWWRFALVMPAASTAVTNIFREGFRGKLLDDEQAVMVRDKAGWHRANDLRVRF